MLPAAAFNTSLLTRPLSNLAGALVPLKNPSGTPAGPVSGPTRVPDSEHDTAMFLSADLHQLLDIGADGQMRRVSDAGDFDGGESDHGEPATDPAASGRARSARAAVSPAPARPGPATNTTTNPPSLTTQPRYDEIRYSNIEIARRYASIWHSPALRDRSDRRKLMQAWSRDAISTLRAAGRESRGVTELSNAFQAMAAAFEVADQRLKMARAKLVGGDVALAGRLADARVHPSDVNVYLDRAGERLTRMLCDRALTSLNVLWMVPSVDTLIRQAVQDARQARHTTNSTAEPTTTTTATPSTTTRPPEPTTAVTTATTRAVTLAAPSFENPIVASGGLSLEGFPIIRNREQALQALRDFERNWPDRLPQYSGYREDLTELTEGTVRFRNLQDMAISVPCALSMREVPAGYGDPRSYRFIATYPPYGPARSKVEHPIVHGTRAVVTTVPGDIHQVQVLPDSSMRISTGIYTDSEVEKAKQLVWWTIRMAANIRSARPRPVDNG